MKNVSLIIFIIVLIIPQFSLSQSTLDYGNEINHVKVCNYVQANSFSSNEEAEIALELILSTVGAEKRFILRPCSNINNAVALQISGIRYIFYDPDFIKNLSKGELWIKFFVLAHEVGHHVNGHVVDINSFRANNISLSQRRLQELEADRFAGFILSKLGASLKKTIAAVNRGSNSDDTYSTHPNRNKRVLATTQGFNKAKSNESIYTKSDADKYEELYYKAMNYHEADRFQDALYIYNYLISNNNNLPYIYYNRGEVYHILRKYNSAIYDYKYQIRLTPNNSRAYYAMGNAYHKLSFKDQAVSSYLKSIKMMESGSDHKHIDSYSKPNSKISVWAYAMAALNMAGSRQYFGYSCEYARKAYQLNKYENDLTTEVYRTLIEIINNNCR
jgi:tetratricopeptide (TPR) repeat protein